MSLLCPQGADGLQLLRGDIIPLQQSRKQTDEGRLTAVGKDGRCEIFLSCQSRSKGTAKGFAALDQPGFPDRALAQQAV